AATWRTPATDSACAPSAGWSPSCSAPEAAGSRTSPAWTAGARSSSRAAAVGSCCTSSAARTCCWRPRRASGRCRRCCPSPSARSTSPSNAQRPPRTTVGTVTRRGPHPSHPGRNASMAMDAISVIRTKRDRAELTDEQIDWVIDAYTRGEVADEQMSALAMAILLNGMNRREISRWTAAMIASGERMDFSSLSRPTADKHSTGGVGDKITLPLAPLVAACGAAVPQLSGRGLGHTGGTLDKLESIPGWRALLSNEEMLHVLDTTGA